MPEDRADEIMRHCDELAERSGGQLERVVAGLTANGERAAGIEHRLSGVEQLLDRFAAEARGEFVKVSQRVDRVATELRAELADVTQRRERSENELRVELGEVKPAIVSSANRIDERFSGLARELQELRSRLERLETKLTS